MRLAVEGMKFLWLSGMLDLGRQKGRVFSAPLTCKNISMNLWILEQRRRRKRRKRRGGEKVRRRKMRRLKREIRTEEDD
jgi:hypothetical protein